MRTLRKQVADFFKRDEFGELGPVGSLFRCVWGEGLHPSFPIDWVQWICQSETKLHSRVGGHPHAFQRGRLLEVADGISSHKQFWANELRLHLFGPPIITRPLGPVWSAFGPGFRPRVRTKSALEFAVALAA